MKKKREVKDSAEALKRTCAVDFQRLQHSFKMLAAEVGAPDAIRFALALYTLDSMGMSCPVIDTGFGARPTSHTERWYVRDRK